MSTVAIVGAGYVGVPLAHVFAGAGHTVMLVDVQADRIEQLHRGERYIEDVPSAEPQKPPDAGRPTTPTPVDVQPDRIEQLNRGERYIEDVPSAELQKRLDAALLSATTDYDELR